MTKNIIMCEMKTGDNERLLTTDDLKKVRLSKIVGFIRINKECLDEFGLPIKEKYVVGLPYKLKNFEQCYHYSKFFDLYPYDLLNILKRRGECTEPEEADCYINILTRLPMKKEDNMYILTSRVELINLLRGFLEENERSIDEQVKPKSRVRVNKEKIK